MSFARHCASYIQTVFKLQFVIRCGMDSTYRKWKSRFYQPYCRFDDVYLTRFIFVCGIVGKPLDPFTFNITFLTEKNNTFFTAVSSFHVELSNFSLSDHIPWAILSWFSTGISQDLFLYVDSLWGPHEIDWFANDDNHKLPVIYSRYWNVK
jgi:hypothetical protein